MSAYEIRKDVPVTQSRRTGLTEAIRNMVCGDSIVIPVNQISSAHPCATAVGARVTTRKNEDGTVTVWRIDEPFVVTENIFGEPVANTSDKLEKDIFK